jgi:hypothetical protein
MEPTVFNDLMSKLAAAHNGRHEQSRPERTHAGCTMEAMEDRLMMAIVAVNGGGNTPNGEAGTVPRIDPTTCVLLMTR